MRSTDHDATQAQAFAVRLFTAGLAAAELLAAYIGIRLGLYEALRSGGPATAAQLAARGGIAHRYAREWLEQQSVAGVLEVDDPAKAADDRLYFLPPGHAEALLDAESLFCVAPMALLPTGGIARVMPKLIDAYRTGGGVPYADYGDDFHVGQAMLNRAVFRHQLASWIERHIPDVHAQLLTGAIRVADIGCGAGWSSISLAQAYSRVHVDGFDLHEPSLVEARGRARASRVGDRVTFECQDIRDLESARRYGLVCIFDALHDMSQPVGLLRACRALIQDGGSLLLMEPRAAETFTTPGNEIERFLYTVSLLHCLPVGLCDSPSAATGTVMRPSTVRAYATEAGFTHVDILPIDHRFHRFYRLRP